MSWDIIFQADTLAMYGRGLIVTLSLLLSSLATGGILALLCALALTSGYTVLEKVVGAFTYFVRGTPLLLQVLKRRAYMCTSAIRKLITTISITSSTGSAVSIPRLSDSGSAVTGVVQTTSAAAMPV